MRCVLRVSAWSLVLLTLAGGSWADIVVLDNGRFLRTKSYRVKGEQARIELESGGELVLPIIRIDRVFGDEIERSETQERIAKALDPVEPIYLGFAPDSHAPEAPFGDLILTAARDHNVNPDLVAAIVRAESVFDPNFVSSKGARGLMQLMPATGKRFGVVPSELFDPELNIIAGVSYLENLIDRYTGDVALVLAAYKAGEAAVERHRGVPPFRETREYIRRIYTLLGVAPDPGAGPGT